MTTKPEPEYITIRSEDVPELARTLLKIADDRYNPIESRQHRVECAIIAAGVEMPKREYREACNGAATEEASASPSPCGLNVRPTQSWVQVWHTSDAPDWST